MARAKRRYINGKKIRRSAFKKDSVVEKAKLIYGVFPKHGVSHVLKYKDKRGLLNLQEESSITN